MMPDPVDPSMDAIAAAQAALLAGTAQKSPSNVRPIRPDLANQPDVHCVSAKDFLAAVEAPDWVIGGIVQRGYLYALTAPTNHGKTAVSLVAALCVAAGMPFAGCETAQGNVLVLCGENQDGFRLRMLATMQQLGIAPADLAGRLWVYPRAAGLLQILDGVAKDAEAMGDLAFVLVDTSVSFFDGADENDNVAALTHALALRKLTQLPGHPAVMANCHPTGSALYENCVPRGGSAFLNEIDTNLTVWADDNSSVLHWTRKKRGPDFDALPFEYRAIALDQFGRKVPTVVAVHISEEREEAIRRKRREEENRILFEMHRSEQWTFSEMALSCGFVTATGKPHKSKVSRVLARLKDEKLVAHNRRRGWHLTGPGVAEAVKIT